MGQKRLSRCPTVFSQPRCYGILALYKRKEIKNDPKAKRLYALFEQKGGRSPEKASTSHEQKVVWADPAPARVSRTGFHGRK